MRSRSASACTACHDASNAIAHVTTFGGGVWHGPAEGDPSATEDVVVPAAPPAAGASRLDSLVEANVLGTHAFQVGLARRLAKGDAACYPRDAPTDEALAALERHQAALLRSDLEAVYTQGWARNIWADMLG